MRKKAQSKLMRPRKDWGVTFHSNQIQASFPKLSFPESPSLSSAWPQPNGTQPRLSAAKKQHYSWHVNGDSRPGHYKYHFCTSMNDWWLTCIRFAILSVHPNINLAGGAVLQENASWHQGTEAAKGVFLEVRKYFAEMFWSTSLESTLFFC